MKRFGIKLENKLYDKNEVESFINQVIDGMLHEELIKLDLQVRNDSVNIHD